MEFNFKSGKITQDFGGNFNVILEVSKDEKHILEPLNDILRDEKVKVCAISHYHKKRSLTANNYAWAIIGKIKDVLRVDKDEVYLTMLKRYGQFTMVNVLENAVNDFIGIVKYAEVSSYEVIDKQVWCSVRVYKGSSQFDTKEMSIFIDGIVQEATELKIPTITEKELEQLKNNWQVENVTK